MWSYVLRTNEKGWRTRIPDQTPILSCSGVAGCWKWGEHSLPKVSSYSYLGIDFSSNGAWDMHIKKLLDNGRKKVNQLHKLLVTGMLI